MSILVLALNPSIDAEWRVDVVQWEEKNIVDCERRWAGGKGVNVARWLKHLRRKPILLIPLGGSTGVELAAGLKADKLPYVKLPIQQATRVNVIITTKNGRQMRFNPRGPQLSPREWKAILKEATSYLGETSCAILSGSLPCNAPPETYARLADRARPLNRNVLVDCDGPAFIEAIQAKPFLVKPNEHELSQWAGRPLKSESDIVRAAEQLSDLTDGWVFVSRGVQGAVLVNRRESFASKAVPPKVASRNTVGAGDALLAAVAAQLEESAAPAEWLRWGVATGTSATQMHAGKLPGLHRITALASRIVVERI